MSFRLFFVLSVCFCSLLAEEKDVTELSGSLLFHVNELIEEWKGESTLSIPFTESEEADLWNSLLESSHSDPRVEKAYVLFLHAKSQRYNDGMTWLGQSAKHLKDYWEHSDPDLLEDEVVEHHSFTKSHNYLITQDVREEMAPYVLPKKHPMKNPLDTIFTQTRAIKNMEAFENAGFKVLHIQPRSFIIVASHRKLPGHLVKVYLDDEERKKRNRPGWKWFVYRCKGARKIAKIIKKHDIKYFTVPEKYLYILPENPPAPHGQGYKPKIAILLVQDMDIVEPDENERHWRNDVTEEHLVEFYTIISRANGSSYRASNIPYTKSGKFAFIDTEYPYQAPDYKSIRFYLTREMREKWDEIVRHGGKVTRT